MAVAVRLTSKKSSLDFSAPTRYQSADVMPFFDNGEKSSGRVESTSKMAAGDSMTMAVKKCRPAARQTTAKPTLVYVRAKRPMKGLEQEGQSAN